MTKKVLVYLCFVLLFVIERLLFMAFYCDIYNVYPIGEWCAALWHGLPHDLTCAGYVMAIPFLLSLPAIWFPGKWHDTFMRWYLRIILVPVLLIFFVDLGLYGFWGFRLDTTPLIYLFDNPMDAIALCPWWSMTLFPLALFTLWYLLQNALLRICQPSSAPVPDGSPSGRPASTPVPDASPSGHPASTPVPDGSPSGPTPHSPHLIPRSLLSLLLCALCFVAIRGGVTTSTMNVGRVYYSTEMPLNHAATNPMFSFFYSMGKKKDFAKMYRFMTEEEKVAALESLRPAPSSCPMIVSSPIGSPCPVDESSSINHHCSIGSPCPIDSLPSNYTASTTTPLSLLKYNRGEASRPNIVLLICESFSGAACQSLYPDADSTIMPTFNRMYRKGIGFTHFYANSFRTDRGVAAVLAAYPGQPTNSVMKDQSKCNNLDYLSSALDGAGYQLQFIHGGDVDFTNMRGFLNAGRFQDIVGDTEFPIADRLSKWGVPDHLTFNYLYDQVVQSCQNQQSQSNARPFFKTFLTLSSHEPFEVDYHHFDNIYINSVAYADSCIGSFIDRLKATPYWDNLLIIALPDHCYANYPQGIQNHESLRYHIPMFWTGGAITGPRLVDTYGSQTDLTATLLAQLGIPHDQFCFSKDLLCDTLPHYAFYTFPDGLGFLNDSLCYIQDNQHSGYPLSGSHDPAGLAERWSQALLQNLYDDLSRR